MRALTTTELEHCAGGSKLDGSSTSPGGYDYNNDTGGGYDASNASNFQTFDAHSGYGKNGEMGYFESIGACADDPFTCIGYGADNAVAFFAKVVDRLSAELGTALNVALYSRIGSQMDELASDFTGNSREEYAAYFERAIANGEIGPGAPAY
jgi:hypothetical protein